MSQEKKIIIISEGSGKTAKRLLDAVLVQYHDKVMEFPLESIHSEIRRKKELARIINHIDDSYLVLFTIVSPDTSDFLAQKLAQRRIPYLNVLQPMLDTISNFLGVYPDYRPGLLQVLDGLYYKKIDSIGFTVEHDDGCGDSLEKADVVLLGPSRCCKTPISMYLTCNYGLQVANIPVVCDANMTGSLLERIAPVHHNRIIGLLMQPDVLVRVREERMDTMIKKDRLPGSMGAYYDRHEVAVEFRHCRDLYHKNGWQTIDVTRRAIEEISLEIVAKLRG